MIEITLRTDYIANYIREKKRRDRKGKREKARDRVTKRDSAKEGEIHKEW